MPTAFTIAATVAAAALLLTVVLAGRAPGRGRRTAALPGPGRRTGAPTGDRVRRAAMFALQLLTALTSGVAMVVALQLALPGGTVIRFVPVGLVWAVCTLLLQCLTLLPADRRAPTGGSATTRSGCHLVAARMVSWLPVLAAASMSAALGLLVATILLLSVYSQDVDQQIARTQAAELAARTAQIETRIEAPPMPTAAAVTAADVVVQQATQAEQQAHEIYLCERFPTPECLTALPAGTGSGQPGTGTETAAALAAWTASVAATNDAEAALIAAQQANAGADQKLLVQREAAIAAARSSLTSGTGLLARQEALEAVIADHPSPRYERWLITATFLVPPLLWGRRRYGPGDQPDRRPRPQPRVPTYG